MTAVGVSDEPTTAEPGRCPFTVSVGALLIGALEGSERNELMAHLRRCGRCRNETVRLAPLPGLLRRLSPPLEPRLW
jgi:hypothetical protein